MTPTEHATLQAALSAFGAVGGGPRVLVVWQVVRRGLGVEGLDALETERVSRLRRVDDRDRYLTAHHLARRVLGKYLGCAPSEVAFDRTCARCGEQHGAPRVTGPAGRTGVAAVSGVSRLLSGTGLPSVSLTHSGEIVGVALGRGGPVGLDVEEPWPDDREAQLADMVRAPGDDPGVGLRELWVAKEAVLKAAGVGLAATMTEVALKGRNAEFSGRPWWWAPVPIANQPGYAAAVAAPGEPPDAVHLVTIDAQE